MAKTYTLLRMDIDLPIATRSAMEELAVDYPDEFSHPNYMIVIDYDDE